MRIRKTFAWACGVILCCAVPAAFCQALSGSLATGTGLSPEAPSGAGGMASIGTQSQVSADANFTMNADVKASANAEAVGDAAVHGGGAGAARMNFRVASRTDSERNLYEPANGRLDFGLERELAGMHSPESKRKEGLSPLSAHRGVKASRARNGAANKLAASTARQPGVSYSTDFPDSTKGTAQLSPPDSTGSPLDWTPGLDYAHFDFAEQQFLEPSLHRGFSARNKHVAERKKAPATKGIPKNALNYPGFSTSRGDILRVRVPDPLADLVSR